MAKKTNIVTLSSAAWVPLSVAGQTNVRVQRNVLGVFKIAVAEAVADLGVNDGHVVQQDDNDMTVFTGLGATLVVYGRALAGSPSVIATAY